MINRIRTVSMNERGQIVIPEDMREDLGLSKEESLILIQDGHEIHIRKESKILQQLSKDDDDLAWQQISKESLKRTWEKEDKVWDELV